MRKAVILYLIFSVCFVYVSAQFHREFNFFESYHHLIDSGQNSWKNNTNVKLGIQQITKVSQGRSNEFYNSLPGTHIQGSFFQIKIKNNWAFQLNPIVIKSFMDKSQLAENQFPTSYPQKFWINHAKWLNRSDDKKSAINLSSFQFYPGVSSIIHRKNKRVWGVGYQKILFGVAPDDGLLLTSNAPNFLKLSYENEWSPTNQGNQAIGFKFFQGWLPSPQFNYESNGIYLEGKPLMIEKGQGSRWMNGFDLRWKKSKVFEFGMNYINMMYWPSGQLTSLITAGSFLHRQKKRAVLGQMGMGSIYAKYSNPSDGISIWGELGTGNSSFTPISIFLRDTLLMGYVLGIQKSIVISSKKSVELFAQISSLQASTSNQAISATSWYVNSFVTQGYTNHGQIIGSGIGPGGASAYFATSIKSPFMSWGFFAERLMHNKDFFYANFYSSISDGNYRRHWMDLIVGGYAKFKGSSISHLVGLSLVKSFNYQWQIKENSVDFFDNYGIDRSGFRLNYFIQLHLF